ncbi:MAG TPA: hypothetical protein VGR35_07500 [Tepidisphaeraceae bacterium]|nr:hypothetical protein [Tepidisphaeraceae bacterium]
MPLARAPGGQQIRPPRGMSPALMKRVALLPQRDRAIIELTRLHLSRSGIARALGMSPGQVSRRLRVLYARLHDPLVVALFDERCPLAAEHRQLGIEHHLLGLSPRELADKHRMPSGEVRRTLVYLRGWHKGAAGRT